jgi:hypothetical protein
VGLVLNSCGLELGSGSQWVSDTVWNLATRAGFPTGRPRSGLPVGKTALGARFRTMSDTELGTTSQLEAARVGNQPRGTSQLIFADFLRERTSSHHHQPRLRHRLRRGKALRAAAGGVAVLFSKLPLRCGPGSVTEGRPKGGPRARSSGRSAITKFEAPPITPGWLIMFPA